jgi:hypothetical protein
MTTLRIFAEDDVPAVAALFGRVYPEHCWASQAACEAYFREVLFHNPWRDLELPSWVAEENGRITGFQAVVPRPMVFKGQRLRVAVGTQFMVDPDKRRGLTALQLLKACLSGPQDVTLSDGANGETQRLCMGLGGTVPLLYSLHWTRPLRPARHALSLLEGRSSLPRSLTFAARPLASLADAISARLHPNRFLWEATELTETALDATAILAHLPDVLRGIALQPVYDARSLTWLLEQTARKLRHGRLRARAVLDGARGLIGWYIYYVRTGDVSEVIQLAARDGKFDCVLQRLLTDAWRHGATAVRGRLDPRFVQELSDRHCWLRREGTWTLVHSRRADVLAAIQNGDAFLSRLEGEWWLRFHDGQTKSMGVSEPPSTVQTSGTSEIHRRVA